MCSVVLFLFVHALCMVFIIYAFKLFIKTEGVPPRIVGDMMTISCVGLESINRGKVLWQLLVSCWLGY